MSPHLKVQAARALRLVAFVVSALSFTAPLLHTVLVQYPTAAAIAAALEIIWREIKPVAPIDQKDPVLASVLQFEHTLGELLAKHISGETTGEPMTPDRQPPAAPDTPTATG